MKKLTLLIKKEDIDRLTDELFRSYDGTNGALVIAQLVLLNKVRGLAKTGDMEWGEQ